MFSNLFGGIFDSSTVTVIPVYQFLLCVVVSLLLGIVLAAAYTYKSKYNAGFVGYLGYAVLYTVILSLVMALYVQIRAWEKNAGSEKTMVITIPEDLDYTEVFDDLLEAYTSRYELTEVKTTNMGSLFKLTYQLSLKDTSKEKEMIDHLRCRNGNLEIMVKNQETTTTSL